MRKILKLGCNTAVVTIRGYTRLHMVERDYCVGCIFSDFFVRMHCFPNATEVADSFNKSSLRMTLNESITS